MQLETVDFAPSAAN